jgi:hypothetical protein
LSDPASEVIKSFHVLMPGTQGNAYPGYYVTGSDGVITNELFFEDEDDVGARSTPLGLLSKMFPTTLGRATRVMSAQHVKIELSQSDEEARWRNRLVLRVGMELPPGFHAYAPEVTGGNKPLTLEVPETEHYWSMPPVRYPKSRILNLPKIGENLPVFEGKFELTTEAAIKWQDFDQVTREKRSHKVEIRGVLHYQICDSEMCFPPESGPVSWTFTVMPYDQESVSPPKPSGVKK